MLQIYTRLQALLAQRDRGATAVEYGLIVAVIAMVVVIAAVTLGTNVFNQFNEAANCVADTAQCPTTP